ncbi:transcriptional regulator family: Fungal Specific TF [Penicillium macrosclerotiorum]|uniref:transcriptional regulator family: Fungal Specific TF n=1 Tax=Penicillium macrosclerotiorum TaxID=303699 RepID=UPI0025493078|nr:transcriptional regulator family: Fungal Specific TF [Penicillium macrosclerotiorum]KAJ5691768.1 transcriptional regulator family: Fungal Specific TF [Penicillium macrosclerotiorum]
MADPAHPSTAGWRIPKACQECRKRKIRCNGSSPSDMIGGATGPWTEATESCKTCQQRNTPCVYRDFIRHRRKKHEYYEAPQESQHPRASPGVTQPLSRPRSASLMHNFPSSVSATHMASPSCQMQLYYGPTSHFALMQHIYRDLVSNPTTQQEPSGGVEEAGAGLDLFSFRRIFFGTPDAHEVGKTAGLGEVPLMFLPYELAKLFLSRYLATLYHMLPHRPKAYLEQCLERMYNPSPTIHPDTLTKALVLLCMATGSLGTDHFAWGDVLFERVKASLTAFDDVVNLQTGRPNSAFLHLGSASRKALSAGLNKDVPQIEKQSPENMEERRITFWSLYLYETWFCFHVGRPSSLSLKDVAIEYAQDPFICLLVQLCKTISRSTNEIYGQRHESLLHMWRVARSIAHDLREHEAYSQKVLGFGLEASLQPGSLGVRQTIFTTLYYHTLLLTFRPFLIFRGHWRRDMKLSLQPSDAGQLRYHGYFIGSSTFTLIYDFLHEPDAAATHLPWVYASLQNLSTMRAGDPIDSTISAIQTVLRRIDPSYEWSPYPKLDEDSVSQSRATMPFSQPSFSVDENQGVLSGTTFPQSSLLEGPETGGSGGSNEDLLDFTQSDMGWNFDFSTMDLEAFFSVPQSMDTSFHY